MGNRRGFIIVSILAAILLYQSLFAESGGIISASKKIYIIPIEASGKNPNPNSFDKVMFYSLYTFISLIPSIDVPKNTQLETYFWMTPILYRWSRMNLESAPPQIMEADYIIYGDYEYTTKAKDKVNINLAIWSKEKNSNIFTKKYATDTELGIFDTVDSMLADIVRGVLHIDFSISRIRFDLRPGSGSYDVFVNDRRIDNFTNGSYQKSLNVLGKQAYHVVVTGPGGKVIADQQKTLAEGEALEISYAAKGEVRIHPVSYGKSDQKYEYYLNNTALSPGNFTTNLIALKPYHLKVINSTSNTTIYDKDINVVDGGVQDIYPSDNWPGSEWHGRIYALGASFGGAEANYFLSRYLYLSGGMGFSYYNSALLKGPIYCLSPQIGAGYYLLGDLSQDWRAGAGLTGRLDLYLPFDKAQALNPAYGTIGNGNPYSMSIGVFGFGEWKFINAELEVYFDIMKGSFYLSPSVGWRF